jgi:uncharacterized protein (TIGR03067 family)
MEREGRSGFRPVNCPRILSGSIDVKQSWFAGALVLLILVPIGRCDAPKGAADESKAVLGSWQATEAEMGGKAWPENLVKSVSLVLSEGKYLVKVGPNPDEGTWKLDAGKKPKELDITGTKGPNMGKTFLCIYELKGDTLKVCYDLSGKEHPKEFKTKPGTKFFLATYKRESK